MSKTAFIYSDDLMCYNFGREHPLNQTRLKLTYELLNSYGAFEHNPVYKPTFAKREHLLLAHSNKYISEVEKLSKSGEPSENFGFGVNAPAYKGMYGAALLSVGATLNAAHLILNNKAEHSFNIGGGWHHAKKDSASHFSIFNSTAIAIAYLKSMGHKVLFLNVDAHHGSGVQEIFYKDPDVFSLSFHEDPNFSYTGSGHAHETGKGKGKYHNLNVPLPPLTTDDIYMEAFNEIVPRVFSKFAPSFVVMQSGATAHFDDPMSHLALSTFAYQDMAKRIHRLAHAHCKGNLIVEGGGGYNIMTTPRIWAIMFSEISETKLPLELPRKYLDVYKELTLDESEATLHDGLLPDIGEHQIGNQMLSKEKIQEQTRQTVQKLRSDFNLG